MTPRVCKLIYEFSSFQFLDASLLRKKKASAAEERNPIKWRSNIYPCSASTRRGIQTSDNWWCGWLTPDSSARTWRVCHRAVLRNDCYCPPWRHLPSGYHALPRLPDRWRIAPVVLCSAINRDWRLYLDFTILRLVTMCEQ